jgi:HAD superfamily hydrolase (TIGR01490 family)
MPGEAAFFDLDKTIIAKSSVLAFGKPFYREGLLSKSAIVKSIYAQIVFMLVGADEAKMEKLRESMLALTKGWSQEHIAEIVRETLDEVISPIVFAEALELFDQHHAAGRRVVIVSSSPAEVVQPLGDFLGADEVIATRAEIDADGNYTGELAFYAYGPHKGEAVREVATREGIDLSSSYAYSDSITDLPMLEVVGRPVAVNPDKELAREAKERGWEVRFFQRPVRLRDRVPVPPKGPTIAVGSVLLTAGAGAAAYVLWRRTHTSSGRR